MVEVFGDRQLLLAREITKAHENLAVRPISGHLDNLSEERGEFTLVLSGATDVSSSVRQPLTAEVAAAEFGELTNNRRATRREAIKTLAERYDIPAREVFALLEQAKNYPE